MRYSQGEKMEIIHMVEHSNLSIKKTLKELMYQEAVSIACIENIKLRE